MIKLSMIGHLGAAAIVNTVNGKTVINFSIAHTDKFNNAQGQQEEKTTWVSCQYWTDKTAVAQYMQKGTQVYIEGQPSARTYQTQNGSGVSLDCRVFSVQLLSSGQPQQGGQQQQNYQQGGQPQGGQPQYGQPGAAQPQGGYGYGPQGGQPQVNQPQGGQPQQGNMFGSQPMGQPGQPGQPNGVPQSTPQYGQGAAPQGQPNYGQGNVPQSNQQPQYQAQPQGQPQGGQPQGGYNGQQWTAPAGDLPF